MALPQAPLRPSMVKPTGASTPWEPPSRQKERLDAHTWLSLQESGCLLCSPFSRHFSNGNIWYVEDTQDFQRLGVGGCGYKRGWGLKHKPTEEITL